MIMPFADSVHSASCGIDERQTPSARRAPA